MREWGRQRHNDHSLWWSILARNKRSVTLNLRDRARPAHRRASCARAPTSCSRTSAPARWRSGASAPRQVHDAQPGLRLRARLRLRPDRALPRPARLRLRRRGDRRACATSTATPARPPPRSGISLGDTLAAQSAFQGILLALYARDARGADRPGRRRRDPRRLLRDARVDGARVRQVRRRARAERHRGCRGSRRRTCTSRSDGKWVVIAANHDTLFRRLAALMGQPELADDPRFATHRARGEHEDLLDEIIGDVGREHTAARSSTASSTRRASCARRSTRSPTSSTTPTSASAACSCRCEDEVLGELTAPGVVPQAVRHARERPARRRAGRSAATTTTVLGERRHLGDAGPRSHCATEGGVTGPPADPANPGEDPEMAYRLGVDVGGTFTDLFLVNDEDAPAVARQDAVDAGATRREGVLAGVRRICDEAGIGPGDAAQRRARHDRRHERGARVQGRPRRAHHDAGLRADPAPRPLPDAGPAGRLDHHDQARPAGLAGGHPRGGRAHGRPRRDDRPRRRRAGRGDRARPRRVRRRVAHRRASSTPTSTAATSARSATSSRGSTPASR